MTLDNAYQSKSSISSNGWITDPRIEDPTNLPIPLGWTILIRPYPVTENRAKTSLIIHDNDKEFLNYVTNIGRVIAIGPSCWTRPEHRNQEGENVPWVKVGDFVSFPKNVGARRKYKGVSFVLVVDDELTERLPDPQVFDQDGYFKIDIPEDHFEKYNIPRKETN